MAHNTLGSGLAPTCLCYSASLVLSGVVQVVVVEVVSHETVQIKRMNIYFVQRIQILLAGYNILHRSKQTRSAN